MANHYQLDKSDAKTIRNAAANSSNSKAVAITDNRPDKTLQAKVPANHPVQLVSLNHLSSEGAVFQLGGRNKKKRKIEVESEDQSEDQSEIESEIESDESDSEYIQQEPRKKSKKKDTGSNIKEGTYKKTATTLEYETESGAKHKEVYDPKRKKRVTVSTNLKYGAQFRNPTHKDKDQFKVYNPYDLSVGQSGLNQPVISHNTPSWGGFQAGGKFGNSSLTSAKYNSNIEAKEKEFRKEVENSKKPFSYQTETEYEDINPDEVSDIETALINPTTKKPINPRWNKQRIRKRLRNIKAKYPNLRRVKGEKRIFSFNSNNKKRTKTFTQGRDLLFGVPRRAYDKKAHKKYIEARGQDSEGSDLELDEPKTPKNKKRKRKKSK